MNSQYAIFLVSICLLFSFCTNLIAEVSPENMQRHAASHRDSLQLHTYMTANQVNTMATNRVAREESLRIFHGLGIQKIILEVYRSGTIPSDETLIAMRDFYSSHGFGIMGGIATVPGQGFGVQADRGLSWFNWQSEKTQQDLEKVVRRTARIFDVFIVDDFLCTGDQSEESEKARGNRTWSAYRMDLLTNLSQKIFIQPAKEENPNITMIVKFPQWYDLFHHFGYDVQRKSKLYDGVWVGTESRGARTQRFGFTQPYEGFFNYRWLGTFSTDKQLGAWFDYGDCDGNDFRDQAWQSVLAGAKEIVFFNAGNVLSGHASHQFIRNDYEELVALAKAVACQPVTGVASYKPAHSDARGDLYINDFLGMLGIPLVPTSTFPMEADAIFLPTQAAKDESIVSQATDAIMAGKNVVVTAGLLIHANDGEKLCKLAGLKSPLTSAPLRVDRVAWGEQSFAVKQGLDLESIIETDEAEVLLEIIYGDQRIPFLTRHQIGNAYFHVLNTRTFSQEDFDAVGEVLLSPRDLGLLYLPINWANTIREAFQGSPGLKMSAPTRVTLQPLGGTGWVIQNYNDNPVKIQLDLDQQERLTLRWLAAPNVVISSQIDFKLGARSRVWVERQGK